jgi:alkylhydroperoxidase/carboxymuconolactone decarboxylase family protein YurZ
VGVELDQASFERGWANAMGTPPPAVMGEWGRFAGAVGFGDVWAREHLSNREKRLVVLTVLSLYGREDIMRMHLGASMRMGELDADELDELAIVLSAYAGLPVGTAFTGLVAKLRAEQAEQAEGGDGA